MFRSVFLLVATVTLVVSSTLFYMTSGGLCTNAESDCCAMSDMKKVGTTYCGYGLIVDNPLYTAGKTYNRACGTTKDEKNYVPLDLLSSVKITILSALSYLVVWLLQLPCLVVNVVGDWVYSPVVNYVVRQMSLIETMITTVIWLIVTMSSLPAGSLRSSPTGFSLLIKSISVRPKMPSRPG